MSLCLSCPICSENYTNADNIYSTQCGHVFHFHCMQQWQSRSTSCPQCRSYNPTSHKIYLNLENSAENEQKLNEIKLQLELSKIRINELEQQEQDVEKIVEVKSELELSIKTSSELQQQLEQSEKHFMSMQKQYNEKEEKLREVEEKLNYLNLQCEYRNKENLALKAENEALRNASLNPIENTENNRSISQVEIALRERLNILEEKLKQVSLELAKEIRNSTDLIVEKMKLQSMLSKYTSGAITAQSNYSSPVEISQDHKHSQMKKNANVNAKPYQLVSNGSNIQHTQNKNYTSLKTGDIITGEILGLQNEYEKNNEIRSVVIRGIAEYETKIPLKYVVLKLAHQMELQFTEHDIENASLLRNRHQNGQNLYPGKVSIVVKFTSLNQKIQFLANKGKLKAYPEAKNLILNEFVNGNANTLYLYAKRLKGIGYKSVYTKNNIVLARKDEASAPFKIKCREEVDKIMADSTVSAPSVSDSTEGCDDQYYSIS